ncbi:MAG: hypothetical protein C5B48_09450, partial [Candidatus Rokuibacteriota bacterium]
MNRRLTPALLLLTALAIAAAVALGLTKASFAAPGDFSIDFAAATPSTYNHATGGGAYNDGANTSVVESLEGGDFKCGETVTYLPQIRVAANAETGPQTIHLSFSFDADSTGQSGIALNPVVSGTPKINTGVVSNGAGPGGTDAGLVDNGGNANIANIATGLTGTLFNSGAVTTLSFDLSGLDPGDKIVVRIDLKIACQAGSKPTGNLHGSFVSGSVIAGGTTGNIPGGAQDITLKNVQNLHFTPTITTALVPTSGTAPLQVHDTATLHNASGTAGGTAKYRYYTDLNACNAGTYDTPGGS